ncbi:hypothetical protein VD0004_g9192 [Verticillium dahliae]|nr:hypothetical protein VD0004_g9192 [Verticillium dahliae]PNH63203.1 hypothetical protein VD0001_g9218 [Verticillium dahliae]
MAKAALGIPSQASHPATLSNPPPQSNRGAAGAAGEQRVRPNLAASSANRRYPRRAVVCCAMALVSILVCACPRGLSWPRH